MPSTNWPFTSQLPREYVLHFCGKLTGTEFKFLIIAADAIGAYPNTRASMTGFVSLSTFMKLGGVRDRTTAVKSVSRLVKMGLLRRIGKPGSRGQMWKLIRYVDSKGQQSLFGETDVDWSGNQTRLVWKPDQPSMKTRPIKRYQKPIINKRCNVTQRIDDATKNEKPQPREDHALHDLREPKTEAEIVARLKFLRDCGNGKSRAAELVISVLTFFCEVGYREEIERSWKFHLRSASRSEYCYEAAFSDSKDAYRAGGVEHLPRYFTSLVRRYQAERGNVG